MVVETMGQEGDDMNSERCSVCLKPWEEEWERMAFGRWFHIQTGEARNNQERALEECVQPGGSVDGSGWSIIREEVVKTKTTDLPVM